MLQHQINVTTDRCRVTSRRDFLRNVGAAAAAGGAMSWTDRICLATGELKKRGKACIVLWMAGGPSQFETFSPKPGHESGGETRAISTSVPGIQIADRLPEIAQVMDDVAIIRSMSGKEGSHPRATYLMHHGYLPMGGVKFPSLGANVAQQVGNAASELPGFVRIGGRGQLMGGGGFLGVDYDPLVLQNATRPPRNSQPASSRDRYERRLALLDSMQGEFARRGGAQVVEDHRKLINASSEMILSPKMDAFDLDAEPASVRDAYGDGQFASGCLLARRLLEAGVTFVEVNSGGWDTHQDNFAKTRENAAAIDRPTAALLRDLKSRGMLDDTLVVWMGEFGRTPKINARGGRDHYPKAFNVALAGGGVRGGQVIGETDPSGSRVIDRPVTPLDLYRSIYTALGIDPDHENMSLIGRPIKLVDGGETVTELFG